MGTATKAAMRARYDRELEQEHGLPKRYPAAETLGARTRLIQFGPFCRALDISKSTGWRMVKAGRLKPPIVVAAKIRAYPIEYLQEVIAELAAETAAVE